MRYAFQDDENCFFVLDLMLGGDLRCQSLLSSSLLAHSSLVHLERLGSMPEDVIRFYVAQLSSAVQFLHDNNIMHRFVSHYPCYMTHLSLKGHQARQHSVGRARERTFDRL